MKDDYQKHLDEQLQDIDFKEEWELSKWKQYLIIDLLKARSEDLITQKQLIEMIDYIESNGLKMGRDTVNFIIDKYYKSIDDLETRLSEADHLAEMTDEKYTHDEVFERIRKRLKGKKDLF